MFLTYHNQAYIVSLFSLALTYFHCHLFCMVKMRKIVDDNKVLSFQPSLFIITL